MKTDSLTVLPYQDIEIFVIDSCGRLFDVTVNYYILYMSLNKIFSPVTRANRCNTCNECNILNISIL